MKKFKKDLESVIVEEAKIFIKENLTVRKLAEKEGISKSAVFYRLNKILPKIDYQLYIQARKVFDKNKLERTIRGGNMTKLRWASLKKN